VAAAERRCSKIIWFGALDERGQDAAMVGVEDRGCGGGGAEREAKIFALDAINEIGCVRFRQPGQAARGGVGSMVACIQAPIAFLRCHVVHPRRRVIGCRLIPAPDGKINIPRESCKSAALASHGPMSAAA